MLDTELTRKLGIRIPVIQGGMQWVGLPVMAAAVSNAGGLGIVTALTQPNPEALRKAIAETRRLTDKPFGVNLTFLPSINPPDYKAYAQVVIDEGVKVAETAGSSAAAPIIKMYKAAGIYVIHKCTSVRHALSAANKLGVDCLSIDGFECAGHPGEDAAQELKVPFVASGGVATGRQLAAALALGAQGVNCGTVFMATDEAPIHRNIKEELVKATELNTTHMFRTMHNTARVYKNAPARKVVELERRPGGAKFEEVRELVSGARGKTVYETGDVDAGVWSAGVSAGLIKEIKSCKQLLADMEAEAEQVIAQLQSFTRPYSTPRDKVDTLVQAPERIQAKL